MSMSASIRSAVRCLTRRCHRWDGADASFWSACRRRAPDSGEPAPGQASRRPGFVAAVLPLARAAQAPPFGGGVVCWYSEGGLKPCITHRFPLDGSVEAIRLLTERWSYGKVVVELEPS
jgi:hypothetical protein